MLLRRLRSKCTVLLGRGLNLRLRVTGYWWFGSQCWATFQQTLLHGGSSAALEEGERLLVMASDWQAAPETLVLVWKVVINSS